MDAHLDYDTVKEYQLKLEVQVSIILGSLSLVFLFCEKDFCVLLNVF